MKRSEKVDEIKVGTKILWGLLVGSIIGVLFNVWGDHPTRGWLLKNILDPVGQIFLRSLFVVVVPLVFSSLIIGVSNLGSSKHIGKLGLRIAGYYIVTSFMAILIGQGLVTLVSPGENVSQTFIQESRESMSQQVGSLMQKTEVVHENLWPGVLYKIFPNNLMQAMTEGNMLGIIFLALMIGILLVRLPASPAKESFRHVLETITELSVMFVGWIMKIAPFAVAALIISVIAKMGSGILVQLSQYVAVVIAGFAIHLIIVQGALLRFLIQIPISEFFKRALPVFVTAFTTSSSNATMPTSIRTLQNRFGVSPSIATFSIPLGATINMDGTALFEIVAALFVAQVFGIHLGVEQHLALIFLVLVTSIGVAGVPGGSIPILMAAMATLGIPPEGIALILGVDRLLDMGRTVVNVTGDLVGSLYLAKVDGWILPRT